MSVSLCYIEANTVRCTYGSHGVLLDMNISSTL